MKRLLERLLVCLLLPLVSVACWIDVLNSFPVSPLNPANYVLSPVLILFSLCLPSSCFFDENTNDAELEPNRKKPQALTQALSCVTAVVIIFIAFVAVLFWGGGSIGDPRDSGFVFALLMIISPLYALGLGIAFGLHYSRRQASVLRQTVGYVGAITGFPVYLPAIVGLVVALIVCERKKNENTPEGRTHHDSPGLKELKQLGATIVRDEDGNVVHLSFFFIDLKRLTSLKVLDLGGAGITDANLQQLKQLVNLKELSLDDNQVTAAGVAELQKALPDCKISH